MEIWRHKGRTPIEEQTCPWCGHILNMSTLGKRKDPKFMLLAMCAYCKEYNINVDGRLRKPETEEEFAAIERVRHELGKA